MTTYEVFLHETIRLDIEIRSQNVHFHDSFLVVSSRAVRISSRAVRVFPALSHRRVRPSYGTFFLMVFQENCARGRTGHMIICTY